MNKPRIKAIIFDLGGVVMHGGYLDFIHHYLGKHLSAATKKRIEYLEHQVNLGKITENQFYRHLQKEFAVHLEPVQMRQRIIKGMSKNKALVKYIASIKKPRLAVFSNSIGHLHMDLLKKRHLAGKKLFDKIYFSSVMHVAKPTRSSFQYVVRGLKVKPREALMVDDRLSNVQAAKKYGLHGVVFKNTAQFKREIKKYLLV